jgi:hypothetical protein
MVDRLTDTLADKPVENSVGRSAFEGAITAPLSGGKTLAQLAPQAVAGGVAGGVADAANRAGTNPIVAALLAMGAGGGAGKVASKVGLSPAEIIAQGRLQKAGETLTPAEFSEGAAAHAQGRGEGVQLLPSQAMQTSAPGYEELQRQLLASKAGGADAFRAGVAKQPGQIQTMIERLRSMGGQTPRSEDELAAGVQKIAAGEAAAGPKAVNQATKPLYNDPLGQSWKLTPDTIEKVGLGLDEAIFANRADAAAANALKEAKAHLDAVLNNGQATPAIVAQAIQSIKNDLPSYSAYPNAANHTRAVVAQTIAPLEALIAQHAPKLGSAASTQAALRQELPTPFNEVMRQAGTTGGTEGALNAATTRPEVMGAVSKANPLLAQELVQRQLNQAADSATAVGAKTNLPPENSGILLKKALTEGVKGKAFDANLEYLFPGKPEAAADFRTKLAVAANASKPRGVLSGADPGITPMSAQEMAIKGTKAGGGDIVYVLGALARAVSSVGHKMSDNATIAILQRPDVIERLAALSALPTPRLTQAAIIGAVPQLFEDTSK